MAALNLFILLLSVTIFQCVTCDFCDTRSILFRLNSLETQAQKQEAINLAQNDEITALRRQLSNSGVDDTYFLASIGTYERGVPANGIVPWNFTRINPGGHFNQTSHGYRAPVHGIYQFSVTLRTRSKGPDFLFMVDNSVYYYYKTWAQGTHESGSATIMVELTAGQLVRLKAHTSLTVAGIDPDSSNPPYYYSWFSGFLLSAL